MYSGLESGAADTIEDTETQSERQSVLKTQLMKGLLVSGKSLVPSLGGVLRCCINTSCIFQQKSASYLLH